MIGTLLERTQDYSGDAIFLVLDRIILRSMIPGVLPSHFCPPISWIFRNHDWRNFYIRLCGVLRVLCWGWNTVLL